MKPIKVTFTEKTIEKYQGSWFQWKNKDGEINKGSWFKPNYDYGVVGVHFARGGKTFYGVQRLNKTGSVDKRTYSNSFQKEELIFLEGQNLDLEELL